MKFFIGDYCENELKESCPVSWWGHHRGVCGPCNCMVDNGYNPHCNKTTGQCYCKVMFNFYRIFLITIIYYYTIYYNLFISG